jgi:PAS domain S-box-containing protein
MAGTGLFGGLEGLLLGDARKRSILELAQQRDVLAALLEGVGDAVVLADLEGNIKWCNDAACRHSGFGKAELMRMNVASLVAPEHAAKVREELALRAAGKASKPYGVEGVTKSGARIPVEVHSSPLFTRGAPSGVMSIVRDVTQRKKLELALKRSIASYETIFEHTGTAVIVIDADTRISKANSEFERLTGFPKSEIEGTKSWTEFVAFPEELAKMRRFHAMRRASRESAPKSYKFTLADRRGEKKEVLLSIDVIPGTTQSVASLIDVTDRLGMQEGLKKAYDSRVAELREKVTEVEHFKMLEAMWRKDAEGLNARIRQLQEELDACRSGAAAKGPKSGAGGG